MKVLRIISEFRIFRLTFHGKVSLKILNIRQIKMIASLDLFSVYLKTIDCLNLKLFIFSTFTMSTVARLGLIRLVVPPARCS